MHLTVMFWEPVIVFLEDRIGDPNSKAMCRYGSYGTSYVAELDIGKVADLELIEPKISLFNWHILCIDIDIHS